MSNESTNPDYPTTLHRLAAEAGFCRFPELGTDHRDELIRTVDGVEVDRITVTRFIGTRRTEVRRNGRKVSARSVRQAMELDIRAAALPPEPEPLSCARCGRPVGNLPTGLARPYNLSDSGDAVCAEPRACKLAIIDGAKPLPRPESATVLNDLRPGDSVNYVGAKPSPSVGRRRPAFRVVNVYDDGGIDTVSVNTGRPAYFGFNRRVAMTEHLRPEPAAGVTLSRGDILRDRRTFVEYFVEHSDANDFDVTTTDGMSGTGFLAATRLNEFDVLRPVTSEPEPEDGEPEPEDSEPPVPKTYAGHDFFPVDIEDANDLMNAIQEAVTTGSYGDAEAARLGATYDRLQQHFASLYSLGQRLPRS